MKENRTTYTLALCALLVLVGATLLQTRKSIGPTPRSYKEIIRSGELRVLTESSSAETLEGEDTVVGFHRELVEAFALEKHLKLEINSQMNLHDQVKALAEGQFDLIADNLLITQEQTDSILVYTQPILKNRLILVQKKKNTDKGDSLYIARQIDLGGKTVHIPKSSPILYRISNLSEEIGDSITVTEEECNNFQLMQLVSKGDFDYAVCEESSARRFISQFPNLDISIAISFNQFYGWGVNRQSPALLDSINAWLNHYAKTKAFKKLAEKYQVLPVEKL